MAGQRRKATRHKPGERRKGDSREVTRIKVMLVVSSSICLSVRVEGCGEKCGRMEVPRHSNEDEDAGAPRIWTRAKARR